MVKIDVKKTMGEVARLQGQPGPFGPGGMDELMRRFGGIPFAQRGAPPAVGLSIYGVFGNLTAIGAERVYESTRKL